MLKQIFTTLTDIYNKDLSSKYWSEIVINYCDAGRYYHTLAHVETMYKELMSVKESFEDWDTVLLALFYHDIIYNTRKNNNEALSAEFAREKLIRLAYPSKKADRCIIHILATKGHCVNKDMDTNLFTDADLSVLGQSADVYKSYTENIRKEYFIYPDNVYNEGRKKLLKHFLSIPHIFKTDIFHDRYEKQARKNLTDELDFINKQT